MPFAFQAFLQELQQPAKKILLQLPIHSQLTIINALLLQSRMLDELFPFFALKSKSISSK